MHMKDLLTGCLFCLVLLVGIYGNSCSSEVDIRLTRTERARIDTIYLAQVDTLKRFTDSFCVVLTEQKLQAAVDSIIILRKKESEDLRARYHPSLDENR